MRVTIIDLEFTQPGKNIIDIGAVTIDLKSKKFEVIESFDSLCNPGDLPDEFIEGLTGIKKEEVASAEVIRDVLTKFWSHTSMKNVGAWGSDLEAIMRVSSNYKVPFKWPKAFDFKQIVNFIHYKEHKTGYKASLKDAIEAEGLEFEGFQHRAYPDALNTAKLVWSVFNR
jgi:inhibitor of KinA sporulation pathway (predicted exonuclease)